MVTDTLVQKIDETIREDNRLTVDICDISPNFQIYVIQNNYRNAGILKIVAKTGPKTTDRAVQIKLGR